MRNEFEGGFMKGFFRTIGLCIKYFFIILAFLILALYFFNYACTLKDIFHYRNLKILTVKSIADRHIAMEIPVSYTTSSCSLNDYPLSVYATEGDFGMYFNSSKKKNYFRVHRCLGLACAEFEDEITEAAMEKALFEEFYPLALSEEKRYTK